MPGAEPRVVGADPALGVHLRAWCRAHGHGFAAHPEGGYTVRRGRGGPAVASFDLDDRDVVWADLAPRLYAHAAAAQWDPATAVDWSLPGGPAAAFGLMAVA